MWRISYKGLTLEEFLIMAYMNMLEASFRRVSPPSPQPSAGSLLSL